MAWVMQEVRVKEYRKPKPVLPILPPPKKAIKRPVKVPKPVKVKVEVKHVVNTREIGARLKLARKKQGMDLDDFAEWSGVKKKNRPQC